MLEHKVGACCSDSFPFYGNKISSPQHVALHSAGLNLCIMEQGHCSCNNTFICINPLRVLQFAYNPCDMLHVGTHERACSCSMSPVLGVCLPYKDFLDITQFHHVILLVAIYVTRLDKRMCG